MEFSLCEKRIVQAGVLRGLIMWLFSFRLQGYGLSVPFTGLLPQNVALTVFSFLTLSRELLHIGGFSKNIPLPLGSDFPLEQDSL